MQRCRKLLHRWVRWTVHDEASCFMFVFPHSTYHCVLYDGQRCPSFFIPGSDEMHGNFRPSCEREDEKIDRDGCECCKCLDLPPWERRAYGHHLC